MPRGVYPHKQGADNPLYKGDNCTIDTAYWRAAQLYPGPHRCSIAGCRRKAQRHHIDGNPRNNHRSNIAYYCIKHHAAAEDRGRHRRGRKRTDLSRSVRSKMSRLMASRNRARRGVPHSRAHNAAVARAIKAWWAARKAGQ